MSSIACGPQGLLNLEPVQSRRTDPITSKLAAEEHRQSGRADAHCSIVLRVLQASAEPLTYREVFKRQGEIKEAVEIERRLSDLRRQGLVKQEERRQCRISQRQAMTWVAA